MVSSLLFSMPLHRWGGSFGFGHTPDGGLIVTIRLPLPGPPL